MSENTPLSKMTVRQLLDLLMGLLHQAHGGDYYKRFNEIAKERGRKIESSHFSKMDTASIQLLIETIVLLKERNAKAATHIRGVISELEQPPSEAENTINEKVREILKLDDLGVDELAIVDEKAREYQISRLKEAAALLEA